jgi:shikimate kinase
MARYPVNPLVPGRNLVLIGLMGSGKTTVGRLVAERLHRPFVDTDALLEAELGMAVAEVFATRGERAFRAAEAQAIRHVSALRGQVVAVGGGAVVDTDNVLHLKATGDVVLLAAEPAELAARVAGEGVQVRPLLAGGDVDVDVEARLAALLAERAQAYRQAADVTLDTSGRTAAAVVDDLLAWATRRPGLLAREEIPA